MQEIKYKQSQEPHLPLAPQHTPETIVQRAPGLASLSQRTRSVPHSLSPHEQLFLQRTIGNRAVAQLFQATTQSRHNSTGLPDTLKAGVEHLSGLSLDDVQVHYQSSKPVQLAALAYTQGTDIYVGPGQEQHLPHETWHVVQQKEGRVRPTREVSSVAINDEMTLEHEAEAMGARAMRSQTPTDPSLAGSVQVGNPLIQLRKNTVIQRRAPRRDELNMNGEEGDQKLFDSNMSNGVVFTKNLEINSNSAMDAIQGYITAIRAVGNVASAFRYTDWAFPNYAANMPSPVNWALSRMGTTTIAADLLIDATGMTKLFGEPKTKEEVRGWLVMIYDQRDGLRNNKYIGLVDPFLLRLTLQSRTPQQNPWEITTQFADSAAGYIIRVVVGNKNITGQIVTAGEFLNDQATNVNVDELIYSSTHHGGATTFGSRVEALGAYQGGDTAAAGTEHVGLDAITWMAAEGARFQPVAAMRGVASPQTVFFTKPKSSWNNARSVTLHWLMSNWGLHFGRAYGISAETIGGVVAAQGAPIAHKPNGKSYNLTKGRVED